MHPTPRSYVFGHFRVDPVARRLWRRDGSPIPLTPRVFDTLLYLIEHCGAVLGKDELIAAIWPGRVVEENNLSQSVSALRRALSDGDRGARYILTVPGRGYRFVAEARAQSEGASGLAATGVVVPLLRRPARVGARRIAALSDAQGQPAEVAPWPAQVLAVLPFRPLLPEQRHEALVMGMAEVLIARLSNGRELAVRPLSLTRRYDATGRDPLAAGRDLGADIVLDGGLQRDHDRLRVTARLLRIADGVALWAGRFDVEFTGVFDVQDSIAGKVAEALALQLGSEEKHRLTRRDTSDVNAYQCYLTGRHHIAKLTPAEIGKGIGFFEQAIALDPKYALAYAGAADAYRRLPIACDWRPTEAFPQAQSAALKALELDKNLAAAHFALGFVRFWYDWHWAEAEAEFRRAIELGPDSAEPYLGLAHLLSNLGRQREALAEIRRARELDPLSLIANTLEASFLSLAQRDEEALARLQKTFDIDPDFWVAQLHLGGIHFKNGRTVEAIAALERARSVSGGTPQTISALGYVYARTANLGCARACLHELHALSARRYVPPSNLAVVHCGLGEIDRALEWLERAYAERDVRLTFLRIDRRWDVLRDDRRFAGLAKRMALD
jgi:DNA-binding winged helix-turn-helix (wHTH) protein/TolB-like protein/tetratricopeptide (TPR) repeat protein